MSIINFVKKNINAIKKKIGDTPEKDLSFNLVYREPNELLTFEFKGSGTFGNIFRIINNTKNKSDIPIGKSITIKILKTPLDETMKLQLLKNTIKKRCKNTYIRNKYIANVLNVDFTRQLIFMEYVEGDTLEKYIRSNIISKNEMYLVYLRTLLAIKVFHNILKFGHRDLKPINILYDKNSKILKCIDFGFICQLEDKKCKNRHQGTSKYIHADMNKKYTKYKRREKVNFPDSISQDLFSTIITLFKMYIHASKQKGGNNLFTGQKMNNNQLVRNKANIGEPLNNKLGYKKDIVLDLINNFEDEIKKSYDIDNRKEKEIRYLAKKNLFQNIKNTNLDDVEDLVIKEVFKIIKKYWNFDLNTFSVDGKKSILISNFLFDTLVFNIFNVLESSADKDILFMDWSLIYAYNLNIKT